MRYGDDPHPSRLDPDLQDPHNTAMIGHMTRSQYMSLTAQTPLAQKKLANIDDFAR
jgi:hypothetical protein